VANILTMLGAILNRFALGRETDTAMIDERLLTYDLALAKGGCAVRADETSVPRNSFAASASSRAMGPRRLVRLLGGMARVQAAFQRSVHLAGRPHRAAPTAAPPGTAEQIRSWALELGADMVGFCEVTPDLIFADKSVPYRTAIVVAQRMDNDQIATAPSPDCMIEVMRTYLALGVIVNRLSKRMVAAGWDAVPGPALGGAVSYPSLAVAAGLGIYGRHGLLISAYNGSCQRLAAVFTNLELEPTTSDAYDWVPQFCAQCGRCVRSCPSGAIREAPLSRAAGHARCVEPETCLAYFGTHYGCSVCIKVCPFTTQGYERVKKGYMG